MATQAPPQIGGLFDQAVQAFNETLKAGVKIQEDLGRWWTDAFDEAKPGNEWQKQASAVVGQAIPAAQRSAEEWLKVLDTNYRRSTALLKKAFEAEPIETEDLRARTQDLWRESLDMVKQNGTTMAQANIRMMELWSGVLKNNIATAKAAAKKH